MTASERIREARSLQETRKGRATNEQLMERCHAVNHRLVVANTGRAVAVKGKNGSIVTLGNAATYELVEFEPADPFTVRTIAVGTKREIVDYLDAMTVGIDLFRSAA